MILPCMFANALIVHNSTSSTEDEINLYWLHFYKLTEKNSFQVSLVAETRTAQRSMLQN